MTKVWIVDAEFPYDNRPAISVHATKAGADAQAAVLCNEIFRELDDLEGDLTRIPTTTAATWATDIVAAVDQYSDDSQDYGFGRFDVWVVEMEVQ